MTKVDGRKGSRSELYELRKQAVQLHEQRVPVMQIVERTGLSWPTVNSAIKRYQEEGEFALMPLARGRKNGTGRMLTAEQESEIRGYIRKKRPKFYGLKKSLWDRGSVQQLIAEKYGAELSERLIGNYLRRWDLTPKQYKRHGYDNCSPDIRRWLDSNYAEILRQARDDGAEIYWLIAPKMVNIGLWRPDAHRVHSCAHQSQRKNQ
jgi:transposase